MNEEKQTIDPCVKILFMYNKEIHPKSDIKGYPCFWIDYQISKGGNHSIDSVMMKAKKEAAEIISGHLDSQK